MALSPPLHAAHQHGHSSAHYDLQYCPPPHLPTMSPASPWPHGVHLDVGAARGEELLVDVAAVAPHGAGVLGVVVGAAVVDLAEQALDAATLQGEGVAQQQRPG